MAMDPTSRPNTPPGPPPPGAATTLPPAVAYLRAAGAFTAGAALVHAAAAGTHGADAALVWLFSTTAVAQACLAAWVAIRPSRAAALATAAAGATAVAAWAASRTVGLGAVDALAGAEPVGIQDLTAAVLAAGATVAAARACVPEVARAARRGARALATAPAIALVVTLVGVTADHSHDDHDQLHDAAGIGAAHAEGADHVDAEGHDHAASTDGAGPGIDPGAGSDPVFAGADTSGLDDEQLEAARDLVLDTRAAVEHSFDDVASVEAAGYRSIGDGRRPGSFRHYVHPAYLADGHVLDPERPESLVFRNDGAELALVSAMYIAEPGTTSDEVPDIAGHLTTWHDHTNLCWAPDGVSLAGVVVDGRCVPGGVARATPPMLHVWLEEHECGPFAGVEAHGATAGQACAAHGHGAGS